MVALAPQDLLEEVEEERNVNSIKGCLNVGRVTQ